MLAALRRSLRAHFESGEVTHAVYGTIVVLAVIVVLERHPPSSAEIFASVLGAAVAVALAEIYAEYVGTTVRERRRPTRDEWRRIGREMAVGFGLAVAPAGFFVLDVLGAIGRDTAFAAAQWSGVAILGGYAAVANRLVGLSWPRSLLGAVGVALVGVLLVLLKQAFH